MSNITIAIYRYFQKHRGLFYTILVVSSLLFVALGTRLSYEEDISKLLPSNEIGSSEQLVFNNLKVKDKIFVLFVSKSDSTTLDEITETCDAFSDSLLAKDKDSIINDITYNIPEEFLIDGIAYLYDNLPLYLDSTDYTAMDTIFTKSHIERQMSDNYEELLSASGMYSYDIIRQDPAGLRYALKSKGKNISESMGGSYKIINKHFFTPDSTVAVAFITPNFKAFDSKTGIRLTENIEAEIKAMNKIHPEIEILFHGAPIQSVFNSRQIKTDLMMTMGLSLLFVCIIIAICFRNKSTLPFLLSPVIYGTFFALACMYLTQGTMSLMAVGIGAIVLGVALSYCLHVLTHYKYLSDPEQVLRDQTRPVILGSLTTIGAFMGLLFTESALLRDFGLFASLAMVGTTIFCLIFLPQFLNPEKNRKSEKVFRWLEHINAYPLDKQKWLIITLVIISVICTIYSQWVCFDTNLKNIGYTNPNVARSSQILSDKIAHGKLSTYFAVTSDNLDSALVYNERLGMRLDTMKQNGDISEFAHTSNILMPKYRQEANIKLWNSYWTADKKLEVKRILIECGAPYGFNAEVFEPFFTMIDRIYYPSSICESNVLPKGLMSNWVEYTDSTYMLFTPVQMPKNNYRSTCDAIVAKPHTVVIDPFYYTQDMVRILNNDFNIVLAISSLFVFLVLLISYRSLSLAIIAFIPMGLSWYIVLGIMSILGIQFNLINIIVSSFIFGVGVDYSIFVMDGLLAGTRNYNKLLMFHKTAIFLSAIVLMISISSLIFATHPAISSIGLTTLIGMTTTLLITYSLEPFLFHWLQKKSFFNRILQKRKA